MTGIHLPTAEVWAELQQAEVNAAVARLSAVRLVVLREPGAPLRKLLRHLWAPLRRWPVGCRTRVEEARQLARDAGVRCPVAETHRAAPSAEALREAMRDVDHARGWWPAPGLDWLCEVVVLDLRDAEGRS